MPSVRAVPTRSGPPGCAGPGPCGPGPCERQSTTFCTAPHLPAVDAMRWCRCAAVDGVAVWVPPWWVPPWWVAGCIHNLAAQSSPGQGLQSSLVEQGAVTKLMDLCHPHNSRCVAMLKAPPIQSALQRSVLGVWSSALDMSWIRLLSRPFPKESVKLTELTPTAHFE